MLDTKQPCRSRPGCLACGFPFWSKLTDDQQDALCRATRPVQYPKGSRIHSPLESCVGILLVRSGQLRAYILSEDGRDITLYRLFAGEVCILSASCVLDSVNFDLYIDAEEDTDAPDYDAKLEALIPVLRGELPVHIHAHRADDIATGIRIAKEFGLKCAIVHGTEAHLIPELLVQEGVPVITGPCLGDRSKPELVNMTIESPNVLNLFGVRAAICTDHPEVPVQHLPLCAAMAVKGGMTPEAALAAITIQAARILGVDDRVGSLTPGKDADLVITSGHPINLLSRVEAVYIGGVRVHG